MSFNTNGFYKVVLRGSVLGNDVLNILWYKIGLDIIPGDLTLAGAVELAQCVLDQIWHSHMRAISSVYYLLDSIDVYPHDSDMNAITQLPYSLNVGEYGQNVGTIASPASVYIVNFNLEPTTILQGVRCPKRGYIALGPVLESYVGNDGRIDGGEYDNLKLVASDFTKDLVSLVPPATFEPIRMAFTKVLGVITLQGWAGIMGYKVNHIMSYRKSRQTREG